jgi:hypothetical protein
MAPSTHARPSVRMPFHMPTLFVLAFCPPLPPPPPPRSLPHALTHVWMQVGPLTATVPPSLAPLPPRVTSVTTPSNTLLCAGGQSIVVVGSGVGRLGQDVVQLVLSNTNGRAFTSAPCTVQVDSTQVCAPWAFYLVRYALTRARTHHTHSLNATTALLHPALARAHTHLA